MTNNIIGASYAYEKKLVLTHYVYSRKGVGRQLLDSAKAREASEWKDLSSSEKFSKWVARHQYKVILGTWATSMAVAGTIIMRDRYVYSYSASPINLDCPPQGTSRIRRRSYRPGCGLRALQSGFSSQLGSSHTPSARRLQNTTALTIHGVNSLRRKPGKPNRARSSDSILLQ